MHTYTRPGLYHTSLTATNAAGNNTTPNSATHTTAVIDPDGWVDVFSSDSSSQYGNENGFFTWNTPVGALEAPAQDAGHSIYYLSVRRFSTVRIG